MASFLANSHLLITQQLPSHISHFSSELSLFFVSHSSSRWVLFRPLSQSVHSIVVTAREQFSLVMPFANEVEIQ